MFFKRAIDALKRGLQKTAAALGAGVRTILHGRALSDEVIDEIERVLIGADVGVKAAREIVAELRAEFHAGRVPRGEDAIEFLKARLKARLAEGSRDIAAAPQKPTVVLVVGINGAGKTTSVAKIARSLRDEGRTVLLAAADTFRAGAVAQLETWSKRLGVDIVKGAQGADPAAVAFDAVSAGRARGKDVVIVDTAGRLPTQLHLMEELRKIKRVVQKADPGAPHEVLLVIDGNTGQNALAQVKAFDAALQLTGLIVTKLDGTAKGGVLAAIAMWAREQRRSLPVYFIGVGEKLEDLQPFDAREFATALLG